MLIFSMIFVLLIVAVLVLINQPQMGARVKGEQVKKIMDSPQYRDGQFQNQNPTPQFTGGATFGKVLREFFFHRQPHRRPEKALPSVRAELKQLAEKDALVWFGHSSYLLKLSGKIFLVDPVLSGHASPFAFTTRSFPGSDVYTVADLPAIDFLLLTHDHYDHLDYKTITQLQPKVKQVITSLGVGTHLQHWGYDAECITEFDWLDSKFIAEGFRITATPARHFSGRLFKRNQTLWNSFVLQTPARNICIGGDSGYDEHFRTIGEEYGPFDLAILECGQYNAYWKHIHMMPEEVVQAALELKAKTLMPVHWGKFALSTHAWREPIDRVTAAAKEQNLPVLHPRIGEVVYLDEEVSFPEWWKGV